jgi:hypothetical protein
MNSPIDFIVQPKEKRYNNTKQIDGTELVLNTSVEDHKFVSREAIVKATPLAFETNIKPGDELIVHHNIFRRFYDVHGNEKNSKSYFKEDTYFCAIDQIFLHKQDKEWFATPGFCFVAPIKKEDKGLISTDVEEPLKGIVKYTDNSGFVTKDQLVGFTPHSEYEFIIDGNRLYRVPLKSISIHYDRKGNETEYHNSWL